MFKSSTLDLKKVVMRRTPHFHRNVPFVVAWSQKSGCTAVLKWFLYHSSLLEEALNYKDPSVGLNIHDYENKIFKASPGYRQDLILHLEKGVPVVNFMRCPYSRAFSSFMQINNKGFINQVRNNNISAGCRVRIALLKSVYSDNVSIEYPVSFLDYLLWLKDQNYEQINPHHAPQYSEIYKYENISHYKLEDFRLAVSSIEERYGLDSSSENHQLFTSGHHADKEEMSLTVTMRLIERALPIGFWGQTRLPSIGRRELEETVYGELIKEIFSKDIEIYDSI